MRQQMDQYSQLKYLKSKLPDLNQSNLEPLQKKLFDLSKLLFHLQILNASRLSIVQHNNADKRQSAVNLNVFIPTSLRNIQAIAQQISIAKASKDIDKRWLWKRFYQIRRSIAILRSEDDMNPFYKVELHSTSNYILIVFLKRELICNSSFYSSFKMICIFKMIETTQIILKIFSF